MTDRDETGRPEEGSERPDDRAFAPGPPPASSRRNRAALALAIALVLSVLGNGFLAREVREREDSVAALAGEITRLRENLDTLRSELEGSAGGSVFDRITAAIQRIRGLDFKSAVSPEILTTARLAERIEREFLKDNPRADIVVSEKVLKRLGVLGEQVDLFELLLAVQREGVGGFYDQRSKRLVVGGNARSPEPLDRVLLAHEYTHAVTDQNFGLGLLDRLDSQDRDDQALAYLSLVEGDATFTMGLYQDQVLTDDEKVALARAVAGVPRAQFDAAPRFLQRSFLFPYEEGVSFVRALHQRGGFALVNEAYDDPPLSTEQILHPTLYITRRDDPTAVTLPDVAGALGAGWRRIDRGEVGEFDVVLLADEYLSGPDADRAAAGWDGGAYVALESGEGTLVAMLTVWDSESEAREATELLGRWLPLRHRNRGSNLAIGEGIGRGWQAPDGAGMVLRNGARVALILGPDTDSVESARAAFRGY